MIYVLTYPEFEPRTAQQLDRFRSVYEPERAKLVPPHVTLVFGLRHADRKAVTALCETVSRDTAELCVDFAKSKIVFDPFEKKHKIFLNCDKGKNALKQMHRQLYEGAHRAELMTEIPYEPHMTVATQEDRSILETVDVAEIGLLPLTGAIRSLQMVELRNGKLNTLGTMPLRK